MIMRSVFTFHVSFSLGGGVMAIPAQAGQPVMVNGSQAQAAVAMAQAQQVQAMQQAQLLQVIIILPIFHANVSPFP